MQDIYQMVSLHIFPHTRISLVGISWDTFSEERETYAGKSNPQTRFINGKYAIFRVATTYLYS